MNTKDKNKRGNFIIYGHLSVFYNWKNTRLFLNTHINLKWKHDKYTCCIIQTGWFLFTILGGWWLKQGYDENTNHIKIYTKYIWLQMYRILKRFLAWNNFLLGKNLLLTGTIGTLHHALSLLFLLHTVFVSSKYIKIPGWNRVWIKLIFKLV